MKTGLENTRAPAVSAARCSACGQAIENTRGPAFGAAREAFGRLGAVLGKGMRRVHDDDVRLLERRIAVLESQVAGLLAGQA